MTASEVGVLTGARPILLSGVYRSGTTFLTAVVNRLPNVVAASSTVKYLRFCLPHHHLDRDGALNDLVREIAERVRVRWDLQLDESQVLAELADGRIDHARVYDAVMRAMLLKDAPLAQRWAEKIAMQWRDIPLFLQMFPEGRVLHIVRDPRDVTASYKEMTYEPWPTFLDAALNCRASMAEVSELADEDPGRILLLRAEDLARDLPSSLERICVFLDEPFDVEFAGLDSFADIKGEDWRANTSFDDGGANYERAAQRWPEHLTPEEVLLVELICQPVMSQFGYEGAGLGHGTVDGARLAALLTDPWLAGRLATYLQTGVPTVGYRSDPRETEMRIVFGHERRVGPR